MVAIIFIIFALIGVPLFAIFGGVALYSYYQTDLNNIAIISEYYKLASQPVLLTIPLFTFAGYLLAESNAPNRLVNVARACVGWMPGGLALVAIISCAFFTAFTGASGVTIIALGGLLYPILRKENYGDKFSMGLVTCCGSLGLLFPPSLPLILYGLIGQVSIDKLFIAGIIPGVVIMAILAAYSAHVSVIKNDSKKRITAKGIFSILKTFALAAVSFILIGGAFSGIFYGAKFICPNMSTPEFLFYLLVIFVALTIILAKRHPKNPVIQALRGAIWELPLPVIIIVAIYGGFITVSEAAAVVAFYVFIVEVFVYRDIKIFSDIPRIVKDSMVLVGGILIILGVAMGLTNFLIDQEVPFKIFNWVSQFIHSKWMFLIALNIFLLVVGCMMDIFSAVIVVVPIISPIALKYGVDPIHLAIIFLTNLEIGYITPPVGLNLFISSFRFKRPIFELYRVTIPFLLLLIVALLIITYIPWLSLVLLNLLGLN
jgi:C4-dicarboxylate transporter, DctM subunit